MAPKYIVIAPKYSNELYNGSGSSYCKEDNSFKPLTPKSVHWGPSVTKTVGETIHKNDMSEDEINCTWYSAAELPVAANDPLVGSFCVRVPEPYCCRRCIARSLLRRQRAWQVVVEESADQLKSGVESDELLTELYQEVNKKCLKEARRRGMRDEYSAYFDEAREDEEYEECCRCKIYSIQRRRDSQSSESYNSSRFFL
jgi:hypothetical protein